jgi:hypothetical protein
MTPAQKRFCETMWKKFMDGTEKGNVPRHFEMTLDPKAVAGDVEAVTGFAWNHDQGADRTALYVHFSGPYSGGVDGEVVPYTTYRKMVGQKTWRKV